jgi:tetratricopeptide (TPR) repeat protein
VDRGGAAENTAPGGGEPVAADRSRDREIAEPQDLAPEVEAKHLVDSSRSSEPGPVENVRRGLSASREAPEPEPLDVPPITIEPLARARDLVREGRIDEAIALYCDIITDHPNNLKARNNLGLLYDGLGQHERALEQFESARAIDPDNVSVISNLGGALIGMGRFEEAERELRRAMKLDLENVDVRANLGILYFRRGQYVQAENELRLVCEKDLENAHAFFYRGEALNRLGKVDKAIEVMERAVRLQPSNARIYHTMGVLFDKKNMPAEAARMYKKVRELSR